MRQKSMPGKEPATHIVKTMRRAARRHFLAKDEIRIVLEGLRGSIAERCHREGDRSEPPLPLAKHPAGFRLAYATVGNGQPVLKSAH